MTRRDARALPRGRTARFCDIRPFGADGVAAAAGEATEVLRSPSMPSGHVFSDEEWAAVSDACERTDCWLLYDAAMDQILFDGIASRHPASLGRLTERTITLGEVTSGFAQTARTRA